MLKTFKEGINRLSRAYYITQIAAGKWIWLSVSPTLKLLTSAMLWLCADLRDVADLLYLDLHVLGCFLPKGHCYYMLLQHTDSIHKPQDMQKSIVE